MDIYRITIPIAKMYAGLYSNSNWRGVRFLCYHSIVSGNKQPEHVPTPTITEDNFRKQMSFVAQSGIKVITMDSALRLLESRSATRDRYICITFDDGYLDNWHVALPVLRKFDYKAHFFITTGYVGTVQEKNTDKCTIKAAYMDEEHLKNLVKEGCSIGSHSITHGVMPEMSPNEIRRELIDSRKYLSNISGMDVDTFAYPYAAASDRVISNLNITGYRYAFIIEEGPVSNLKPQNKMRIRRTIIRNNESETIFKLKITGGFDWSSIYSRLKRRLKQRRLNTGTNRTTQYAVYK